MGPAKGVSETLITVLHVLEISMRGGIWTRGQGVVSPTARMGNFRWIEGVGSDWGLFARNVINRAKPATGRATPTASPAMTRQKIKFTSNRRKGV